MVQSQQRVKRHILLLTFLCVQQTTSFQSSTSSSPLFPTTTTSARHTSIHTTTRGATTTARRTPSTWAGQSSSSSSSSSLMATVDKSQWIDFRALERKIVGMGRAGKTKQALELYYEIKWPNTRLMNGAIDVCSRARGPSQFETAFEIFERGVNFQNVRPNVFTFGALMNVCSRSQKADEAIRLLKTMQYDYNVLPNAIVYSSAISACARCTPTKSGKALDLLREAVEEKGLPMSVVGFNAAISACAQAGDWKNAISVLSRMEDAATAAAESSLESDREEEDDNKGRPSKMQSSFEVPKPDAVTYGTVLAACEQGEQWGLVLKYARSMKDRGLELDGLSVTSCLHACQQLGLAEEALYYLDKMKSVKITKPQTGKLNRYGARRPLSGPDDVAYRLAISACARGGEWQAGIRLLKEFEEATGTPPDVVAYTSAITGCEYAGMWREAFHLLDKMRKAGVEPNEVTMAAVLGACATATAKLDVGDQESTEVPEPQQKALELLTILRKNPNIVSPNIQVYNSAIRACAEAADLKRAMQLLQDIEDEGIERTEVTYGSLMTACERVGCVETASKVFRKMREDGMAPNEIIYGAAISCCRKAKQSERTFLLLKKMMKEGLTPNTATFNTVIIAQAEGRTRADSERAILVYKLMRSKYTGENGRPNRQTYNILINFFASIRQPLSADAFLKKMSDAGFKPDVEMFTATVAAYERTGQPLKALRLMESMQADGYDFYGVGVLNSAFTKAVKLVNKVGKQLTKAEEDSREEKQSLKLLSLEDEAEEESDTSLE